MKKILVAILIMALTLCSCGTEKQEGDALERYLEIIDGLESGIVNVTSSASSNKATVRFRETENGCEVLSVTQNGKESYTNYFDGLHLYSGSDELVINESGVLDGVTAKRSFIGAPDYAIDPDWYVAEKSGIYKTLTGYKIVVVTNEDDELKDTPDTTLTLYLNSEMVPTKAVIEDEIFTEDGKTKVYKTTLKYQNIGGDPIFQTPVVKR